MKTPPPAPSSRLRRSLALAAVSLALVLLSCSDGATAGKESARGAKADFRLRSLDGKMLGPADFKGQVVVVDFWATWCLPCRIQADALQPVVRDLKGRGVQFLGASVGEDADVVRKFLKERPAPYPVLLDPEEEVSGRFEILALPTLLVVDRQGKIAQKLEGITDGDTLRKLIKQAGS
jgi:peroxiredoxin